MAERDEDGFLDRWSRRKRGEGSPGAPQTETAEPSGGRSGPPPAGARPATAEPPPSEADSDSGDPEVIAKLPDLDNLNKDSDFTAFLQDETAAPEGEAAKADAGEVPAAAEAAQDRERDSERVVEADSATQPPLSTESPEPGPAAAAADENPKPVRGSARKRRWGALDS